MSSFVIQSISILKSPLDLKYDNALHNIGIKHELITRQSAWSNKLSPEGVIVEGSMAKQALFYQKNLSKQG